MSKNECNICKKPIVNNDGLFDLATLTYVHADCKQCCVCGKIGGLNINFPHIHPECLPGKYINKMLYFEGNILYLFNKNINDTEGINKCSVCNLYHITDNTRYMCWSNVECHICKTKKKE
jgi:hypothetical protein